MIKKSMIFGIALSLSAAATLLAEKTPSQCPMKAKQCRMEQSSCPTDYSSQNSRASLTRIGSEKTSVCPYSDKKTSGKELKKNSKSSPCPYSK